MKINFDNPYDTILEVSNCLKSGLEKDDGLDPTSFICHLIEELYGHDVDYGDLAYLIESSPLASPEIIFKVKEDFLE